MTDQGLVLVSPTLHTQDQTYGVTDFGSKGIRSFFLTHKCNHICKGWSRPSEVFLHQGAALDADRGTHMMAPKKRLKKTSKLWAKPSSFSSGSITGTGVAPLPTFSEEAEAGLIEV